MLSIHRLSAGDGFRYLLRHTASHDVNRSAASSLTSYYAASGYPPGRWLGSGLAGVAGGRLAPGDEVTETQMGNLYGRGLDPVTGAALGRAYRVYRTRAERVADRTAGLDQSLSERQRAAAVTRIEAEERRRRVPNAVAGFDLTFSPVKSVSALWAIADKQQQAQIVEAHHEALNDIVVLMEREVAFTRTGAGGVAQLDTRGLIAAAFDHWDSRAGDPQLHTHLVVANRVQGLDGRWRTLDGRVLYAATVALSETYNGLLADKLTSRLGVGWEHRERESQHGQPGRDRNPAFEISGVPPALVEEFSARTAQIEAHLVDLVAQHRESTGRDPSRRELYVLQQQATLTERPHKDTPQPLSELVESWRRRAGQVLLDDPRRVVAQVVQRSRVRPLTADQVDDASVVGYAATVVLAIQQQRATWNRWNVLAETARQTRSLRLATATDRTSLLERITDQALGESVSLTAPGLVEMPERLRRADGASVFSVHRADRYTSTTILGAEAYLLDRAASHDGLKVPDAVCAQTVQAAGDSGSLGEEQAEAVRRISGSGRGVEVLVGAAGAGKTTTLRALRQTWEAQYGPGSVLGLAPSSTAAEVLAQGLGIATENTAKWLYESVGGGAQRRSAALVPVAAEGGGAGHRGRAGSLVAPSASPAASTGTGHQPEQHRWQLRPNQLLIVDEASLAGTLDLAALARQAHDVGAKVLLVGDDAQLSAIDAGGAFRLLANETDAVELTGVWRFNDRWERAATLRIRRGDTSVLEVYQARDRIADGDDAAMADAAYRAWLADVRDGRDSILLAADTETVTALNQRARLNRINTGEVEAGGVALRDNTQAGVGDRIITRLNVRRLLDNRGRSVRNGAMWTIDHRWADGSLTAHRDDGAWVTLPAGYVAESVELAYASTVHRAQGVTVDTAHVIARAGMSREALYVGMTRGRAANHAYVVTQEAPPEEHQDEPAKSLEEVVTGILTHTGAERSATEIMRDQMDAASSLARLVPMYEHMAQAAEGERWRNHLTTAGLEADRLPEVVGSPAWPAFVAALRDAEAQGLDAEQLLTRSITSADFTAAHDTAAVLHARLDVAVRRARRTGHGHDEKPNAGVIVPAQKGGHDPRLDNALADTEALIAQRAHHLAQQALANRAPWLAGLDPIPAQPHRRSAWEHAVTVVAAYRERHGVTSTSPLGPEPLPGEYWHARDHARAARAIDEIRPPVKTATRSDVPPVLTSLDNAAGRAPVHRL